MSTIVILMKKQQRISSQHWKKHILQPQQSRKAQTFIVDIFQAIYSILSCMIYRGYVILAKFYLYLLPDNQKVRYSTHKTFSRKKRKCEEGDKRGIATLLDDGLTILLKIKILGTYCTYIIYSNQSKYEVNWILINPSKKDLCLSITK